MARAKHMLLDLFGVAPGRLSNPEDVRDICLDVLRRMPAGVIAHSFYTVTGGSVVGSVTMTKGGHLSFCSWASDGVAAIDIFDCDGHDLETAMTQLAAAFVTDQYQFTPVERGAWRGPPQMQRRLAFGDTQSGWDVL